jgi:putative addiction module killer protein
MVTSVDMIDLIPYVPQMIEVQLTREFLAWLKALRDRQARKIIARRIERAAFGNVGKMRNLGQGLNEMKIDHGPGYRLYFIQRGEELIILLCGGDKSTQDKDIARARKLVKELKNAR